LGHEIILEDADPFAEQARQQARRCEQARVPVTELSSRITELREECHRISAKLFATTASRIGAGEAVALELEHLLLGHRFYLGPDCR
jgi:uncharacterized small protein (DUF1192 family)